MKQNLYIGIIALICAVFLTSSKAFSQDYYWYKGQKLILQKNQTKRYILVNSSIQNSTQLQQSLGGNVTVKMFDKYKPKNQSNTALTVNNNWAIIEGEGVSTLNISGNPNIIYQGHFYKAQGKDESGLSHLFYVKLKNVSDFSILQTLATQNNVEVIGANKFMPLWYTLSCSKKSFGNALQMANLFYETGNFAFSEPDWLNNFDLLCGNDQFFNNQWGLKHTGQHGGNPGTDIKACDAWQLTKGSNNVIVAVLDHGVELNHPDLNNVHAISYDTETGTSPSVIRGSHGTACAGIIGANLDNNIGVAGLASNSPIMSISDRLVLVTGASEKLADGINFAWQNGAAVISNSWGHNGLENSILNDAIINALTLGRNGLGCVLVFAAGNSNGPIIYPANSSLFPDIIAVGAMSPCAERKNPSSCDGEGWGSCFGSQLDVVAPGVKIPTTDLSSGGYDPTAYTQTFNGTSSATPHVAGLAALILSVNHNLTQKQVADIIESTAQKVGGYTYATTTGRPNGTWDDEIGYGLINALDAVQKAKDLCTSSQLDLFSKDNWFDTGTEPNPMTELPHNSTNKLPYLSTDIWVRRSQGVGNRIHENPEHSSTNNPAQLNYVYVSVRNRGCQASQPDDSVYLHWAKASTALTYPQHWYGNLNLPGGNNPKAGDIIGGIKIDPPIQPGEERVFEFTWNPPSPNEYSFNDEPWHFCLLSRIESNTDPITDYSDIGQFVVNNNNVAWKNLTVIDSVAGIVVNDDDECITDLFALRSAAIGVGNFTPQAETYNLSFSVPTEEAAQPVTQNGTVLISLAEGLYNKWVQGGRQGTGFTELNPHNGILTTLIGSTPLHDILFGTHRIVFEVNSLNVQFKNITLQAGENYTAAAMVLYPATEVSAQKDFNYDAIQRVASTNHLVGGVRYQMYKPNCPALAMGAGANQTVNLGCEATLAATNQQLCGTYEWTNQFGNVVSREATFTARPLQTSTYNLKAVSPEGCVSNSQVTVNVNNQLCSPQTPVSCFNDVSIYPNPSSSNTLTINLQSEINVQASITIRNVLFGNIVKQVNTLVSTGQNTIPIDISNIVKGLYQVRITCPNNLQTPYTGLFSRQ